MRYHTIHSAIWEDDKVRKISLNAAHLFIYLFSNYRCAFSGIYKISPETMEFESRVPFVKDRIDELAAINLISYDFSKNVVWVHGKLQHNKSTFASYGISKSILNDFEEFRGCSFDDELIAKYPELIDLAINIEQLRKQRYKQRRRKNSSLSESVSVSVKALSVGSR